MAPPYPSPLLSLACAVLLLPGAALPTKLTLRTHSYLLPPTLRTEALVAFIAVCDVLASACVLYFASFILRFLAFKVLYPLVRPLYRTGMAFAQRYAGANGGVTAGLAAPSSSAAASASSSLRKPFHAPHAGSLTLGGPLNTPKLGAAHPNARPITRSSIWFADGNIVLVARRTAFRVHRGQLARHSDVFRDLFMVPQPPPRGEGLHRRAGEESWDGEGTIDGCAAVELHDAPADVTCLLKALYDGLCVFLPSPLMQDVADLSPP